MAWSIRGCGRSDESICSGTVGHYISHIERKRQLVSGENIERNRDSSFEVAFDDGDAGQNVPSDQIQIRELSKTKAAPMFELRSQVKLHRDGQW